MKRAPCILPKASLYGMASVVTKRYPSIRYQLSSAEGVFLLGLVHGFTDSMMEADAILSALDVALRMRGTDHTESHGPRVKKLRQFVLDFLVGQGVLAVPKQGQYQRERAKADAS